MPTANMNTATPTWLSSRSTSSDAPEKMKLKPRGQSHPSSDGPSRMPAVISPTTTGSPSLRKIEPTARVAERITATCSSRRTNDPPGLRSKTDHGMALKPARACGAGTAWCAAGAPAIRRGGVRLRPA